MEPSPRRKRKALTGEGERERTRVARAKQSVYEFDLSIYGSLFTALATHGSRCPSVLDTATWALYSFSALDMGR